ncbi:MAG: hypothetical protein JW735_05600 [Prolixibacteraceae bacterium]|nr:hypothetical protein [Prolixibacteraceae bacterium]
MQIKPSVTIKLATKGLFIFTFVILFNSCGSFDFGKNTNEGKEVHLNDTIWANQSQNYGISNEGKYELNIDKDQNTDITFWVENHSLGRESYYISKIIPQNNYSIITEKGIKLHHSENYNYPEGNSEQTEEVEIPKIFSSGDTISKNYSISNDTITLAYRYQNAYTSYSWSYEISQWVNIGEKYIGLYNSAEELLAWILIDLSQHDMIYIKSYYYQRNIEYILIQ